MREDKIKLPARKDGTSDWKYIERRMRAVIQEASSSIDALSNAIGGKNRINQVGWATFSIGELFLIKKGARLTKAQMKPGTIRFIGSSSMNNGRTALIGNVEHLHSPNTITVCYNGSVGEAFYQDEPFWASDDVNILYPKFEMNRNTALFIIPLIRVLGKRYDYTDKWKTETMAQDKILLPIQSNESPDWDYMESFMHKAMIRAGSTLDTLGSALREY